MSNQSKTLWGLAGFLTASLLIGNFLLVSAAEGNKDIAGITSKVFPSVVRVEARNTVKKIATGVVIDNDGHIVTTGLITPRDEEIIVITSDRKRIEAEFLGMDALTNLALIKAKDKKLPAVAMGKFKNLSPGSWIAVVSLSPENMPAVTQGIVSSLNEDSLRLNIWVVPGMSGSPVVDSNGQMVGLLRGVYADEAPVVFEFREKEVVGTGYVFSRAEAPASGMAQAISVDIVGRIASEIKKKGKVERGWLGVGIAPNEDGKVEIVAVEKESPAELAGLKEGDIVLEFEGKAITSTEMLAREIRSRKPGDSVKIKVERKGKAEEVKVRLGESEYEIIREFESKFPRLFPSEPDKLIRPPRLDWPKAFSWRLEKRKYVGVYLEELNKELAEYFGVREGQGLLISKITPGSPAEKAGLKVGDVIVKVDEKTVETVDELIDRIQELKKGDKIKVEYVRDKKKNTAEVEIGEEESQLGFQGPENWDEYLKALNSSAQEMTGRFKKWQERYAQDSKERMEKIQKELMELSKKAAEEAKQKSKEAGKALKLTVKKYRSIKV